MFVSDRTVGSEGLGDVECVDVVDGYFGRDVGGDGTEGESSGVNDHLTVESGIEWISGAKAHRNQTAFAVRPLRC